jgi:exonuclease 1
MGIQGLLPMLKDITNRTHIRQFAGKRAAIDGYGWLYKGAYSCPRELCEDLPTDKYVKFCMSRIRLLLHHEVIPIVVFDGDKLPAKDCTEVARQRCAARRLMQQHIHVGIQLCDTTGPRMQHANAVSLHDQTHAQQP